METSQWCPQRDYRFKYSEHRDFHKEFRQIGGNSGSSCWMCQQSVVKDEYLLKLVSRSGFRFRDFCLVWRLWTYMGCPTESASASDNWDKLWIISKDDRPCRETLGLKTWTIFLATHRSCAQVCSDISQGGSSSEEVVFFSISVLESVQTKGLVGASKG